MSESTVAEIIPFPSRVAAPVPATQTQAKPGPAEERLTRALIDLNNAVLAQRAAMTAWKSALGDLRTVTGRLGNTLRSYNDSLTHLDARVSTLRSETVKLEYWADGVLTRRG